MSYIKIILTFTLLLSNLFANKNEKIILQFDWLNQFQFAGYYIAKEKDYYKNLGLDVQLKEFDFDVNLLDSTLKNENQYSVGKSSLIIDKLEGKDIVLLAAIYQNSPMILLSLKKSNIPTIVNLKNKKVMMTPDARTAASINSMIISQGLKLEDIKFQKHSFNLEDLINGKTDVMASYLSNEPFLLKQRNIKYNIHNPSDYGFNFYGGLLFTSLKELKKNPARVRKMHEASIKGWNYAFNNIEETAQLIFDKYNTQNKSLESLIYEGYTLKKLARFDEGLLGNIDYERIEEIKRLYLLLGLSKNIEDFKIKELIYNPYTVHLSKKQKEYLKKNYLSFVTNSNFPPFTMKIDNKISGIEVDYWNLILKKLNIKSHINIINEEKGLVQLLKEEENTIKFAYSSKDYSNFTDTTDVISNIKIALVTLNDKPFTPDISALKDIKIALNKHSVYYKNLKESYPLIKFIDISSMEEGLDLLSRNKVYGLIGKLNTLSYRITNQALTNMKISATLNETFEMKLIMNKENKVLKAILNEAISKITKEEMNNINTKYHAVVYETSIDYSWIYKIILPLIFVILIITISNRKLNNEITKRKQIEKELFKVANTDALTNIYNRRKIEELYNKELLRVKRYNRDLSIIFFDIDNFKKVNDDLGHANGDLVLTKLASIVKSNIRASDYFGRWGGEEFIIILPETSKEKAQNLAYALKDKISHSDFDIKRNVTCSFGVSKFEKNDSADSLLTRVDHAMYYIKRNGKDGVKVG